MGFIPTPMVNSRTVFAALVFTFLASCASAATAPKLSISSLSDLSVPDAPFDSRVNADVAVDVALARAEKSGKRVLIHLGANWCADCRILVGVMELPEMQAFLNAHYEVVSVDVGRFSRNMQIPARFGISQDLDGVPAVLIVSPDGRLLNPGAVWAIEDVRRMTPQKLADWLAQWAP